MTFDFGFVEKSANIQTPEETMMILAYEVGGMLMRHIRTKRYGKEGAYADSKAETSDAISMLRMYCEQMGWDFNEMMKYGERRYMDRMEDLRKYGKGATKR